MAWPGHYSVHLACILSVRPRFPISVPSYTVCSINVRPLIDFMTSLMVRSWQGSTISERTEGGMCWVDLLEKGMQVAMIGAKRSVEGGIVT